MLCIYPEEGKLVHASVSVDAGMPILDINTGETKYERYLNDFRTPKNCNKNTSHYFAIQFYKTSNKNTHIKKVACI